MVLGFFGYIIGAFLYVFSSKFRDRKQKEWEKESSMYKIHEIGMWVSMPLILLLLFVVLAEKY